MTVGHRHAKPDEPTLSEIPDRRPEKPRWRRTFTALEAELLAQLERPAAAAALAELAALYGDL